MRVLILGGAGMLGHKLWQAFQGRFDTWITLRSTYRAYARYELFDPRKTLGGVDALDFDSIAHAFALVRPDVVINCVGIIKQLPSAKDPIPCITVNSLFPHRLANLCQASGSRMIHISTDCVFTGHKGMYTEEDPSDADDLYGRTKFLGEVNTPGCLTLRTSIIGRELQTANGLVEWFLGKAGQHIQGYTNAIFTGFTTQALADVLAWIIEKCGELSGLYQVSTDPISKYDLLCLLRDAFNMNVEIEPYPGVRVDRSLDSTLFRTATGFSPLSWPAMVQAMAKDPTPYKKWKTRANRE